MPTTTDRWSDVVGQHRAVAALRAAAVAPVHAYLLVGPEGWGARSLVRAFAAEVLTAGLAPDEADRVGRLVLGRGHADVMFVEREGNTLRDPEVADLLRLAYRQPTELDRKVIAIPRFDRATPKAWSQLLKVIEEPPPSTIWMLLADEVPVEMATIASRSVVVELDPVSEAAIVEHLVDRGVTPDAAAAAARASAGDVELACLLAGDERLALRLEAWRRVPEQLDGTGHVVWRLVAELRAAIDDALAHVKAEHDAAEKELAERIQELGLPKGQLSELATRHKRQIRKARTDEIRLGLATIASRYREAAVATYVAAVPLIDETYEALFVRNANEPIQLQSLFLRLPPVA